MRRQPAEFPGKAYIFADHHDGQRRRLFRRLGQFPKGGQDHLLVGARGIGEAYVRRFVQEGSKVVIGDVLDKEGLALAKSLGPAVRYRHCDVTKKADVEALMDEAVSSFGGLDVCIPNAGIVSSGSVMDETEEEIGRAHV